MSTKKQPPAPYRPPAPDEQTPTTRVFPDCIHDPTHSCPGGIRPISEFRLFTGKAANRYKDGRRWSTYCRYHERLRGKLRREALKAAGLLVPAKRTPLTPEQQKKRRERARALYGRHRTQRIRYARLMRKLALAPDAPPELVARRQRYLDQTKQWAEEHAAERKAYRAKWWREKVDREIAAGLRPPRDIPQKKLGRPRKYVRDLILAVQGRYTALHCVGPDTSTNHYEIWRDHGLPTATKEWEWPSVIDWRDQEQIARDTLATYAANESGKGRSDAADAA